MTRAGFAVCDAKASRATPRRGGAVRRHRLDGPGAAGPAAEAPATARAAAAPGIRGAPQILFGAIGDATSTGRRSPASTSARSATWPPRKRWPAASPRARQACPRRGELLL